MASDREINGELNRLIRRAQGSRSQNQFSRNCGVSSSNLTRILNGERAPTPEVLQKIASAQTEVSYDELMHAAFGCSLAESSPEESVLSGEAKNFALRYSSLLADPGFLALAGMYEAAAADMRSAIVLQTAGLSSLFGIDSPRILRESGAADTILSGSESASR